MRNEPGGEEGRLLEGLCGGNEWDWETEGARGGMDAPWSRLPE